MEQYENESAWREWLTAMELLYSRRSRRDPMVEDPKQALEQQSMAYD